MALGSPGPLLQHPGHPNFLKKGGCQKVANSLLKFYLKIDENGSWKLRSTFAAHWPWMEMYQN